MMGWLARGTSKSEFSQRPPKGGGAPFQTRWCLEGGW